ncbi:glycoside hydrolase family 2 [Halococcus sp. AFM35]|uniref:glycoside hydrolase family 2 n=1 Tax=Halococcus sp. AFM35 TaxID=3421653 RepID=UPI003EBB8E92
MELCEWTAAAVDPSDDPPEADDWRAIESAASPDRFAGERAVAYRTRFPDPRDGEERALLALRGLYAHARVWLNGEFVGSHDTYFTPFRTTFDPEAENELLVECRAPTDRFGGVFETSLVPESERVPGIRWGARVEGVPESVITDLTIRTDESGDDAGVNAIVTIDAGSGLDGRVRLSLRPEGAAGASALSQVGVTASAGERVTVQGRLSVRDPDRWWPRGVGPQHRYTVRASLGEHERTATTGFRTVEYDAAGMSVNGTRVPVRGLVSLPVDGQDATGTVERAVAANATLLRWYGHVPPESFYEAADAAGVLVMQDVPMGSGALDAERARSVARTLAGAVGHRPSLAAFGVHDDAHEFDVTTEAENWRVCRSTGDGGAATATAATAALPDDTGVVPTPGLDAGREGASWVLDGRAESGARTRYVVPEADGEAATHAKRAIEALRLSNDSMITAFRPPTATDDAIDAAFEPVNALLDDPTATEPAVVIVNDTTEPVAGDLDWTAGTESGTLSVDVAALTRESVGAVDLPADAERVELSLVTDEWQVSNEYER